MSKKLIERLVNSGVDIKITNTLGMERLVDNASGRNRSVYEKEFKAALNPAGIHVLSMQMLHNDSELRTLWLCKMTGQEEPAEIWLDVDFEVLDAVTVDSNELP